MNRNDERFLLKVVDMYYNDEMSQEQIAKKLAVSRTTISRAITKAKKNGYVKIIINYPEHNAIELEKELETAYGLKEATVISSQDNVDIDYVLAKAAAHFIARVIKKNMRIGMAWGNSLKRIVDTFEMEGMGSSVRVGGVEVIPLLGTSVPMTGKTDDLRFSYSSLLASKLAEQVGGVSYSLPAPAYVRNSEIRRLLLEEPQIKEALERAKKCDLGIFGLGTLSEDSSIMSLDERNKEMIEELRGKGGIGETVGRVFDAEGNSVVSEMDDCMIGLTLEEIRKIPLRVGVARGREKLEAIRAALKSGLFNVIITDEETAGMLLQ